MDIQTISNPGHMDVLQVVGDGLIVEFLPEKGGDIYKICIDRTNILWESPWGISKLGNRIDFCHTSRSAGYKATRGLANFIPQCRG